MLRLFCPSEQSWAVILKASCAAGFPSQHDTAILRELKAKVKRGDQGLPHEVVEYPVNPEELKFFAVAYANEELGKIDEERILHTDVSLRKTNKAAKAHRSGQYAQDAVNTDGQGGQLQGGQMNPQKFMLGMMNMMNMCMMNPELDIEMLRPSKRRQKAIANGPADDDPEKSPPADPGASQQPPAVPGASQQPPAAPGASRQPPAVPAIEDVKPDGGGPKRSLLETFSAVAGAGEHDGEALTPEELTALMKKPASKKPPSSSSTIQKKPAAKKGAGGPSKPVETLKKKHGWIVERRYRADGQVDVHYRSPKGGVYRTLKEARANGYRD